MACGARSYATKHSFSTDKGLNSAFEFSLYSDVFTLTKYVQHFYFLFFKRTWTFLALGLTFLWAKLIPTVICAIRKSVNAFSSFFTMFIPTLWKYDVFNYWMSMLILCLLDIQLNLPTDQRFTEFLSFEWC